MTNRAIVRPTIVCLCGSTKFKSEFEAMTARETLLGKIVLTVGFFHHKQMVPITADQKQKLDELHLDKIEMADEVLMINPNSYIGESTRSELAYAIVRNKAIHWLDAKAGEAYMEDNSHLLGRLGAKHLGY